MSEREPSDSSLIVYSVRYGDATEYNATLRKSIESHTMALGSSPRETRSSSPASSEDTPEEPWDERPRGSTDDEDDQAYMSTEDESSQPATKMRKRPQLYKKDTYTDEEDDSAADLDDGELPALSIKSSGSGPRMGGRMVGGQVTRTRPLSPPSTAGLSGTKKYLKPPAFDEDMPDDELMARKSASNEFVARRAERRQTDSVTEGSEDAETIERDESSAGILNLDANIWEYAVSAVSEMCGLPSGDPPPKETRNSAEKRGLAQRGAGTINRSAGSPDVPYGVEEQTAIEVEYVDPNPKREVKHEEEPHTEEKKDEALSSTPDRLSPKKKNDFLAAMAKKAKDNYKEDKNGKDKGVDTEETTDTAADDDEATPDNVYSSFTATEKRKFLKLINSGLTPTDSTRKVIEERAEAEKAVEKAGESSSKGSRGRKFPFFGKKNNEQEDERIPSEVSQNDDVYAYDETQQRKEVNGASVASSRAQTDPMETEETRFASSGINYYDAVRKERNESDDDDDEESGANRRPSKKKSLFPDILGGAKARFSSLDKEDRPSTARKYSPQQQGLQSVGSDDNGSGSPLRTNDRGMQERLVQSAAGAPALDVTHFEPKPDRSEGGKFPDLLKNASPSPRDTRAPVREEKVEGSDAVSTPNHLSAADDPPKAAPPVEHADPSDEEKEDHEHAKEAGELSDDEAALRIMERELQGSANYKSTSKSPGQAGSSADASSTASSISRGDDEPKVEVGGMDLDLETYLDSTEMFSTYGSSAHDHVSVVSTKSHRTAATGLTGATGYTSGTVNTAATRKRRPGAAKRRLREAREADKGHHKVGWQESIKAAAENSNRVWDPKKGWVDYVNPSAAMSAEDEAKFEGKIHIPVEVIRAPREHDEKDEMGAQDRPAPIPVSFPADWEQERRSMLQAPASANALSEQAPTPSEISQPGPRPSQVTADRSTPTQQNKLVSQRSPPPSNTSPPVAQRTPPSTSSSAQKPRGWVETMRAATAKINQDGKKWDPELGWVGLDDDAEVGAARSDHDISMQYESDTQDFGTAAVTPSPSKARNVAIPQPQPLSISQPQPQPLTHLTEHSAESNDASARGGLATERYIQIGDTGSVRSHYQYHPGQPSQQARTQPAEVKSKALSTTPERKEIFGKMDAVSGGNATKERGGMEEKRASLLVNVKKEKVGEKDAGFFPQSNGNQRATQGRDRGPVDLDDLDDLLDEMNETGSFGVATDFSWDHDSFAEGKDPPSLLKDGSPSMDRTPTDFNVKTAFKDPYQRATKPVPKSDDSTRDTSPPSAQANHRGDSRTPGSRSVDSMSSAGRSIPKLKGPKRDTSPIGGRKSSGDSTMSASDAGSFDQPSFAGLHAASPNRAPRVDDDRPSQPTSSESPSNRPHNDDDMQTLHTASSTPSQRSSVRMIAQEWESRAKSPPEEVNQSEDLPPEPAHTAEWKSFMAKKMRDESAATADQQGSRPRLLPRLDRHQLETLDVHNPMFAPADGAGSPVKVQGGRPLDKEHDRDSLFDFPASEAMSLARGKPEGAPQSSARLLEPEGPKTHGNQYRNTGRPQGVFNGYDENVESGSSPQQGSQHAPSHVESFEDISELSPIRVEPEFEEAPPSDTGGPPLEETSFLQRLQACAGPILPRSAQFGEEADSVPMAHLAFLRTNPSANKSPGANQGASRFLPPSLCGRPDVILEEDDDDDGDTIDVKQPNSEKQRELKPRSRSNLRSTAGRSDVSSVISDEFGANTSYLDAIAMRTAVSGSKKKSSRHSTGSSDTSGKSKHSEKWQQFLERKSLSGASPPESRNGKADVSVAAEKYAAEKMEEMMETMAAKSRSNNFRPAADQSGAFPTFDDHASSMPSYNLVRSTDGISSRSKKSDSARAAEELAAARVEAMMQSLSGTHLDGGEIYLDDEGEI